MTDDEIRRALAELANAVSHCSGELQALNSALGGALLVAGRSPELAASVRAQLERGYAIQLGDSRNPVAMQAFEEARDLILLALEDASGDSPAQPTRSSG